MRRFLPAMLPLWFLLASCAGPATPPMDQTQATAQMQKLGGQITVNEKAPGRPVTAVNLSDVAITDASLACLEAFPHLQKLDLGHTGKLGHPTITDAGLTHIAGLTELRRLSLTGTGITDAGLVHLKALSRLESLNLERTKITDAGLKRLAALPKLQRLKLSGTAVTKQAIAKLQKSLPACNITF